MTAISQIYPLESVFTPNAEAELKGEGRFEQYAGHPDDRSFDLSVIEFNDDSSFVDTRQKAALVGCITTARNSNREGATVVAFVHGWHHSSRQDDTHLAGFRNTLASLALRESERNLQTCGGTGRRVVGIFLAWQGDPPEWTGLWRKRPHAYLSFFSRYKTAKRIGDGQAFLETVRAIVKCTKPPSPTAIKRSNLR